MKAPLAIALASLAVLAPGCDGVFGSFQIPTRPFTISAVSDNSGDLATGQIHLRTISNDFYMDVICLKIAGNKATVGARFYNLGPSEPPVYLLYYVEDLPDTGADPVQEEHVDEPPTTCPAPPATIRNDSSYGNVWIFDDVQPPQQSD